jgi:hypothetical protein
MIEWKVLRSDNRDVERTHLNRILSDIRANIGTGGDPWDFDDGTPTTSYTVGTVDLEGGTP